MVFSRETRKGIVKTAILAAAVVGLAACGSTQYSDPVADAAMSEITQPGIYAYDDGDIVPLSGPPEWERETWGDRNDLSSDTVLIVHDPSIQAAAGDSDRVQVRKVAWIQQEIVTQTGSASAAEGSPWVVTHLPEFQVPVAVAPLAQRPDMLRVTPSGRLQPGLYSVGLAGADGGGTFARFGVDWDDINTTNYAQAHCVDRFKASGRTAYAPCGTGAGSAGLKIRDLKTETLAAASPPVLVIRGKLTNGTKAPAMVPPLEAIVRDANGQPLETWTFGTEPAYLLPGDATFFQTQLVNPPKETADVQVRITSEGDGS